MKRIENQTFDEERALYASRDLIAQSCRFDGPRDGESAFKESQNISVSDCYFNLRYPFWHDLGVKIESCEMTSLCRAALWYSSEIEITHTKMHGIKALRECKKVRISDCDVCSPEFGWSTENLTVKDSRIESEYFLLRGENLQFSNVKMKGKYSFQYVKNAVLTNCEFDTKDAFWHAENVTVKDSVVNGEYLGWYSDGLTLENCVIRGTQPLCYCKNLKLINCQMFDTDLCFEKSHVEANITTPIISIKNPLSGQIFVPAVGKIIMDDPDAKGTVIVKK